MLEPYDAKASHTVLMGATPSNGRQLTRRIFIESHIAALKTGTVDADILIKRFGKNNEDHPVYQVLLEIGKAAKTIFLCRYFAEEELRIEIDEALNVVERVNSIMHFIFYGKLGEINSNDKEELELSIVCLHLLQACMVYINTLMIQNILSEPEWKARLLEEDKRALTPLAWTHQSVWLSFTGYGSKANDRNASKKSTRTNCRRGSVKRNAQKIKN